jgi:hypothetical protein
MSGFRGTFGNAKDDKVLTWIYNHLETMSVRNRHNICKLIQDMIVDRKNLSTIEDDSFRERIANLVKIAALMRIDKLISKMVPIDTVGLDSRLKNLATRNYRAVVNRKTPV